MTSSKNISTTAKRYEQALLLRLLLKSDKNTNIDDIIDNESLIDILADYIKLRLEKGISEHEHM